MPKKFDPRKLPQAIQFSEDLTDPNLWVRKSDELLAAARLIEPEIQAQWAEVDVQDGKVVRTSGRISVQGPYFVLVAYAVENLLKACLVHREQESLRNRLLTSLPKFLSAHDLVKLAKRVEFAISVPEQDLLTRLSRNSIWAGRYPVPTNPDGARALEQYADGRLYLTAFFGPKDVDRLRDLLDRIRSFVIGELHEAAV